MIKNINIDFVFNEIKKMNLKNEEKVISLVKNIMTFMDKKDKDEISKALAEKTLEIYSSRLEK